MISVLHGVMYLVVLTGGILTVLYPPRTVSAIWGANLTSQWATLMIAGGALASYGALLGRRWLERIGLIMLFGVLGMYILIVVEAQIFSDGNRYTQLTWMAVAGLSLVVRMLRIKDGKYEPATAR